MNTAYIDNLIETAGIKELTNWLPYGEIAELIKDAHESLEGFSEACYDQNSTSDLVHCLSLKDADETDCEVWEIDADEWFSAIEQALLAQAYDYLYDDLIDAEEECYKSN